MKKIIVSIVSLTIFILLSGCHSSQPIVSGAGGSEMLYRYQWNLTEINGRPITAFGIDNTAHLLFSPGQVNKVSGSTGCNRLNGSFA